MRQDLTELVFVLDKSGSMSSLRESVIKMYNEHLEGQRTAEGEANVSLYEFSDTPTQVYINRAVREAPLLTLETYYPLGSTALYDAMVRAIDETGQRLRAKPAAERPAKVIVVTITDGEENSSQYFTHKDVRERIERQQSQYNWVFLFLGANFDAYKVGQTFGLHRGNILNYQASSAGLGRSTVTLSGAVAGLRGMSQQAYCSAAVGSDDVFTKEDREAQDDLLGTTTNSSRFTGAT